MLPTFFYCMRRAHLIIKGSVQGVFFRAHIEKLALELHINGWVKNTDDGVEATFEGEDESIKSMLEFCAIGPTGAKVKSIEVTEERYEKEFQEFSVLE